MKDLKISEGFSFPIEKGGRGKKIPDLLNDFKKVLNQSRSGNQ